MRVFISFLSLQALFLSSLKIPKHPYIVWIGYAIGFGWMKCLYSMTPGTNQICFVSFISHIWHKPHFCKRIKRCKMVFWYLSHKDDTFVSKLSLESSIYFDHSGFSLEVFVMLKWSNSVFWCNKTTMPAIIFRLSQITNQTVPSLRWKVSKNLCQMWEHKHHKANLVTGTETDCC